MTLLLDTGPLLAFLNRADPEHRAAVRVIRADPGPFVLPGLVTAELDYLVGKRVGARARQAFLSEIEAGRYRYEPCTAADLRRAIAIDRGHIALNLGLVDASLCALAERLRIYRVASFDRRDLGRVTLAAGRRLELVP